MTYFAGKRGACAAAILCMLMTTMPAGATGADPTPAPVTPSTAAPAPPAPPTTATITGTVKTSGSAPLAGAKVSISGPTDATTETDASGTFSFTVPPGIYRIQVTKGGFLAASLRDVTVVAGESQPLAITLSQADLSSLRTIGSVSVGRTGTSTINTGAAVTTFIPAQSFTELANPQINDVLQRAPDVTIQHMGSQADTTVIIGGAQPYETQVLIDGHPLALGQYGVWTSQFFPSFILGGAEVQSGPGNTTPFANIAVGGTLNLLTPSFTPNTTAEFTTGIDSYSSQNTNFLTTGTVSKLSYVAGIGQASTNGWFQGKSGCVVSANNDNQPGNTGIIQYCGSLAGPLNLEGDILKFRYAFTPSTSFEAGFLGAWGTFDPQGAAWGNSAGATTIIGCQPQSFVCGNPAYDSYIGKTIQGYVEYPGSSVYNNQTLFDGQFRTALPGNNTLLVRPYIGSIQPEIIDGSDEGAYPAFFGPKPGTTYYEAPTYANGEPIPPTFLNSPNSPPGNALENYCGVHSNIFGYSQIQSPQGTSVIVNGQQECFQYPYSAYEQDKLYGTTFSFLHPIGDSLLNLTYDFHGQSDFAYFNAPSNISVPLSSNRYSTISLTGYLHVIRNVGINLGLYDTRWTVSGVQPELDSHGTPVICPDTGNPCLVGLGRGVSRFDPHFALTFRPTSDISYRAAVGSSATFPFLGQVSGNAAYQPFATSAPIYTAGILTEKNPNLDPEVSIAYNVGVDKRFHGGSVLSFDLQDTTIHNVFETLIENETTADGILGVTSPINVARLRAELATLKYTVAPHQGLGFNLAVSAERSIIDGIPPSAFPSSESGTVGLPANGVQICGTGLSTPGIPTCIPYLKGYGQITYANIDGTYATLGVDYEGKNNAYYQPPFAQVDTSFTTPLTKNVEFLLSVQNLLNTNTYEHLPAPYAGVPLVGESYNSTTGIASQGTYASTLIPAPPRTLHVQVRLHVGR